jgi:hypothetical protein
MRRVVLTAALVTGCLGAVALSAQSPAAGPSTAPDASVPAMSGSWDYNEQLSVDAMTGRPEQAPLAANQRPPRSGGGGRTTGAARPPAFGGSSDDFERRVLASFAAERRALVRDLLEVPEHLSIRVTDTAVTFIDDLDRERTYPSNNRKQKYQLGAAQYEARARWEVGQFHKDIEGANSFKMSELYFLSEDGARLYVVIRIGDPKKPEDLVGVNRVYDRIGQP